MRKHIMGFANLLCFLSYMLIRLSLSTGQDSLECYDTGNFTSNSTYATNRNLILSSLSSNVTANGGFFTASIGQGTDKIYALALCRADLFSQSCASCVNYTAHNIMTRCSNQKEAITWTGMDFPCVVRYSNRSIFGNLELQPWEYNFNVNNITSNMKQFDQIWGSLMDRLLEKVTSISSGLKFATEETNLTHSTTIYALMQCTPDISQGDCKFCLRQNMVNFMRCCYGKQGAYILGPNCIYRWELYPFYTSIDNASSPSPPIETTIPPQLNNTKINKDEGGIPSGSVIIIVFPTIIFLALVAICITCFTLRRRKQKQKIRRKQEVKDADEIETVESLQFDFGTISVATNNFSPDCKLGQGGFGTVYKGVLPDGLEIAVKRLAKNSGQGEVEFKNEVLLVAKLQHRNLVRLLGFCFEGNERLLIYEFLPNSSLDKFLFDPIKGILIDWEKRYKIIGGIARGILYLHEDSRLRIIHRDLKASNILLDENMNPKISDFGMARLFEIDQTQGDTSRIVGTFGYMAPEYVKRGHFSVKSDVFSFGVLVLEIISGQRNNCFHNGEESEDLLTYAWRNWNEETALNILDPVLRVGSSGDIMRCIHIGLLCVQENEASRPTMASVVLMLSSFSLSLPTPSKPAFFLHATMEQGNSGSTMSNQSQRHSVRSSVNEASITELDPR